MFAFLCIKVIYVRIRMTCRETNICVRVVADTLHDASLLCFLSILAGSRWRQVDDMQCMLK